MPAPQAHQHRPARHLPRREIDCLRRRIKIAAMEELRQAGKRIADSYDALPYETLDDPALRPRALLGFGGVFGCAGGADDVLDLGCGTGVQLEGAARETAGRLVGVDLSRENCRRARERLTSFGDRVQIHHADLLDLSPKALGQFDLIHATGLIYVVPLPVRVHVLALIGACLKPGGVALISHYGGAIAAARTALHRLVRAEVPPDLAPADAVSKGRDALARLAHQPGTTPLLREAARLSAGLPDNTFFHEVFNPFCEPVPVSELDAALADRDVRFLGHLEAPASAQLLRPEARAREADARDAQGGAYHYALFGSQAQTPDMMRPGIVWRTSLHPAGELAYRVGDSDNSVQIAHAPSRIALDHLAKQPLPLSQAMPELERDITLRVFRDLWANRLVMPLKA